MKDTSIPQIIHDVVEKVCDEENIQTYDIQLNQGNDKGAGFLGEFSYLTIVDKKTKKHLEIVVKKAFTSETIRTETPIRDTFLNEIYFYTKMWPKLNQFQSELINGFNNVPKCYKCNSNDQDELIIMENLKKNGFELVSKKSTLNAEHIKFIFETYGKFHGISFALRQTQPEEFKKLTKGVFELWDKFMEGTHMRSIMTGILEKAAKALVPGEDDELIRKFERYVKNSSEIFVESTKYKGKKSVIVHGDCWSNNMMFKYNNERKLIDLKLIDWQLVNEGSPIYDLSYCLYSGASQDIIDNLDHYLQIYHKILSKTIDDLGGDSSEFTLEDLRKEWRENAAFGLLMSIMVIKMKLTQDDSIVDFTDMESHNDNFEEGFINSPCNEEEFQMRIRGLLRHLNEIDAL